MDALPLLASTGPLAGSCTCDESTRALESLTRPGGCVGVTGIALARLGRLQSSGSSHLSRQPLQLGASNSGYKQIYLITVCLRGDSLATLKTREIIDPYESPFQTAASFLFWLFFFARRLALLLPAAGERCFCCNQCAEIELSLHRRVASCTAARPADAPHCTAAPHCLCPSAQNLARCRRRHGNGGRPARPRSATV